MGYILLAFIISLAMVLDMVYEIESVPLFFFLGAMGVFFAVVLQYD